MKKATYVSEVMLVAVTVIWGLGFPITKLAVEAGFGANSVLFSRFLVAVCVMAAIYRRRLKRLDRRHIVFGAVTGVFLFLGFYFQTLGAIHTTPSKNAFITQLNIVFVPFLAMLFSRIRVDKYNLVAVAVSLTGLYFISLHGVRFGDINIGDVFTFLCAVLVAFHVVLSSHWQKRHDLDPVVFVFVSMVSAMVLAGLFAPFETWPALTFVHAWPLGFLGVFNTALGFSIQSVALKLSSATRVSLIVAMEGLFGAIGSVLIIGEHLSTATVSGGLLVMAGILITEVSPVRRKMFARAKKEKSVSEETLRTPF